MSQQTIGVWARSAPAPSKKSACAQCSSPERPPKSSEEPRTPAIEVAARILQLQRERNVSQAHIGRYLGVSKDTIERWLRQARADQAGATDPGGRTPTPAAVQSVRMLHALQEVCPGLLSSIRGAALRFDKELACVERRRMSYELDASDLIALDGDSDEVYS